MASKHRARTRAAKKVTAVGIATATVTTLALGAAPPLRANAAPPMPTALAYDRFQALEAALESDIVDNFNLAGLLQTLGFDPESAINAALWTLLTQALTGIPIDPPSDVDWRQLPADLFVELGACIRQAIDEGLVSDTSVVDPLETIAHLLGLGGSQATSGDTQNVAAAVETTDVAQSPNEPKMLGTAIPTHWRLRRTSSTTPSRKPPNAPRLPPTAPRSGRRPR
jgi:hypothetical protein